ncbi:MAG: FRG domain-containing protein [Rectinemataceae bacterium]|jgi:hypothetical protein
MSRPLTSVSGYLKRIKALKDKTSPGHMLLFRGHGNLEYKLVPKLYRKPKWVKNEHLMFKEMVLSNPSEFAADNSTIDKLVRMQHFSMPTRLLDLTVNPIVALYFAVEEETKKLGEVVVLEIPENQIKYYDSDTVSVLSNLCKVPYEEKSFDVSIVDPDEFNDTDSAKKLVYVTREEKPYFENVINPNDLYRVLAVRVKLNNRRIIVQSGAFLLFGMGADKRHCAAIEEAWLPLKMSSERILIDKNSKRKLSQELSVLNITEASLFPDIDETAISISDRFK